MTGGRVAVSMTLEDASGAPRMAVMHLTWSVELPTRCGQPGPPPFPGAFGYICSLAASEHLVHEAWLNGFRLDSWPALTGHA